MIRKTIASIFLIFMLFLVTISCRTLKPYELQVQKKNIIGLPTLKPQINIQSFYDKIIQGIIFSDKTVEYETLGDRIFDSIVDIKIKYYPDKRVEDILKIYLGEVKTNISNSDQSPEGLIQLDLIYFKERRNIVLVIFNTWTLFMTTLLGVPATSVTTIMEIKITIRDVNNQILKSYSGKGKGKGTAFVAMYWGYGEDAWRKSAIVAFKKSMDIIKSQIAKDQKQLILKLNASKFYVPANR